MTGFPKKLGKDYAKDRLKDLLLSERIDCSPEFLLRMKNEIIEVTGKYIPVNEDKVGLHYGALEHCIYVQLPLNRKDESDKTK